MRSVRYTLVFLSCISLCPIGLSQKYWCKSNDQILSAVEDGSYPVIQEKINQSIRHPFIQSRSEKWFQVVVHIISREDFKAISRAQVLHQIEVLNQDFAGRGENIFRLSEEFKDLIADTGLRFCLATTDPEGNPTEGITHTITTTVNIGLEKGPKGRGVIYYDQLGGKSGWDPSRYINIWIVEFGDYLGFSSMPGMEMFPEERGVVIDYRYFGSLGDASSNNFFDKGHTLTHEMGHFFGLLHIWGTEEESCLDTDEVNDTPNAAHAYFDCPSGTQVSCGNANMYQNFMDLTDDRCLAAFTHGQSERMNAMISSFYPALPVDSPCGLQPQPFQQWTDDLVWAYDAFSGQYYFYSDSLLMQAVSLEIFSVDGRRVHRQDISPLQGSLIDLSHVAFGIYIVRITAGDHEYVRKISVYQE